MCVTGAQVSRHRQHLREQKKYTKLGKVPETVESVWLQDNCLRVEESLESGGGLNFLLCFSDSR